MEREIERERQTDRRTDRQTDRQTDRRTDRQTDRASTTFGSIRGLISPIGFLSLKLPPLPCRDRERGRKRDVCVCVDLLVQKYEKRAHVHRYIWTIPNGCFTQAKKHGDTQQEPKISMSAGEDDG